MNFRRPTNVQNDVSVRAGRAHSEGGLFVFHLLENRRNFETSLRLPPLRQPECHQIKGIF